MVGSKDHTNVSTTNIIKPTMASLSADDQHHFDDLTKREEEEEVLRQLTKRSDKEEEDEVLRQLKEQREKATEKYLSYFTVDRHQKIIRQGEIDMTSLLPPPQAPILSTTNPSLEAFMEQRGELLKEYVIY
jgi:hypothetical protein